MSLRNEPKISRVALKCMLQMFTVQLKELLNAAWKVVDNECTFLLGNRRLRWRGARCSAIIISADSFKILAQLENLTHLKKGVETELRSVSCLKIFKRLSFVTQKIWFIDQGMILLHLLWYIKILSIFQQESEKRKKIK